MRNRTTVVPPWQAYAYGTYIPEEFDLGYQLRVVQYQLTLLQNLINRGAHLRGEVIDVRVYHLQIMMIRLVGAVRWEELALYWTSVFVILRYCV